MDFNEYLDGMSKIQNSLLEYVENDQETDQNLIQLINEYKISNNKKELKQFIHIFMQILNNHHRQHDFYDKVLKILTFIKNDIKKYFANDEIYNLFESNNRIILFLINEEILILNEYICKKINHEYFAPEISVFKHEEKNQQNLPENFDKMRKIGENDSYICQLIRDDLIDDFILHVNKNNIQFKTAKIESSIFETNLLLSKRNTNFIEYAAFFGSVQIFKYLFLNGMKLESSLWIYVIHGRNPELIHLLEENNIKPSDKSFEECVDEAIKCHHNEIANYLQNNYYNNEKNKNKILSKSLKYYNFELINPDINNEDFLFDLCIYDYFTLVKLILKHTTVDINTNVVLNI